MKLAMFTILSLLLFGAPVLAAGDEPAVSMQHIRNATSKLTIDGKTFLVDPMLADQGAYEGFPGTYRSNLRNPLTPLPMPAQDVVKGVDAVILTHTHADHWDAAAQKLLPKDIPFYVQNEEDAKEIRAAGFTDVRVMNQQDEFNGVKFQRTAAKHGTDAMYADPELGRLLGDVMGVVFTGKDGRKVWLVGDSIWFKGIDEALATHKPDVIIVNSGGAAMTDPRFAADPEIIMDRKDVLRMVKSAPQAEVVAVHMDAINHMTVDRKDLAQYVREQGIRDRVLIPFDGEVINFN